MGMDELNSFADSVAPPQRFRTTLHAAADTNADEYAETQRAGKRLGLPPSIIPQGKGDRQRLEYQTNPTVNNLHQTAPRTAQWLGKEENAKLAHDDTGALSAIENAAKGIWQPFSGALHATEAGFLSGASSFYGSMAGMAEGIEKRTGMKSGGLFRQWQQQLEDKADFQRGIAANRGISSESLPGMVYEGGGSAPAGVLDWEMGAPMAALQGYQKGGIAGAIAEVTKRKALGKVFHSIGESGMSTLQKMGVMAGTMGAQTAAEGGGIKDTAASTVVGALLSYQGSGGRSDVVRRNLMREGVSTEHANALASMVDQSHQALQAHQAKQALDDTAKALQASKLFSRLAEASEDHLGGVIDHHGVPDTVFIPLEKIEEFFQSGGRKPEEYLSDIKALYEARATGADVPVPTKELLARFGKEQGFEDLTKDVRLFPGTMTAREAEEWQNSEEQQKVTRELLDSLGVEQPIEESDKKVHDDVLGQLIGAGHDRATAEKEARLTASVFRNLGERNGIDPQELYQRYNLKINRQLPDVLAKRRTVDMFTDPLLDRLRAGNIPAESKINGPSLAEFLREKGINDDRGDLAAMGADEALKPFQRKMVREGGIPLDRARELAVEAGYLPEGADINALLDNLDADLRGNPVYSQEGGDRQAAELKMSLDQMEEILGRAGVNIEKMSNEEVREALKDQKELFQDDSQQGETEKKEAQVTLGASGEKQGRIQIGAAGVNITLFEKADLSTFLHETGHLYEQVLADLAGDENASDQVKGDFQKILDWYGVEDRSQITTEHREQFARAFEQYLMEGKAPSPELQPIFQRFKAWLTRIYRDVRNLNVPINDELRGVFDRLVASDEEIERAREYQGLKPLFATAKDAGMTEHEFQAYRADAEKAHEAEAAKMQQDLMAEMSREQEKWWKDESAKVREEVDAEASEVPAYRVFNLLAKGDLDGERVEPVKLDRAALVAAYGEDFVKKLPRSFERIYADGGQDPDLVAEQFGFSSGDEMLKAMMEAPKRKDYIKAETERRMKERYGDMLNDGTLEEKALEAVHNDEQGRILSAELRALRRRARESAAGVKAAKSEADERLKREKAEREYERRWMDAEKDLALAIERGAKEEEVRQLQEELQTAKDAEQEGRRQLRQGKGEAIPPLKYFKNLAAEQIGKTAPRAMRPDNYSKAEMQAAKAAVDAAAKKDYATAAVEKQRQILNHYLFKEALKAQKEAEKIYDYMSKIDSREKLGNVGKASEELLNQIRNILSRYEFRKTPYAQLDRSLEKFLDEFAEEYDRDIPIDPKVLDELHKANYREVPMDELRSVYDAVRSIIHAANEVNKVIKDGKSVQLADARQEMIERADQMIPKKRKQFLSDSAKGRPGSLDRFRNVASANIVNFLDSPSRPEFLMEYLDGGKQGPWHDFLWNAYLEANNRKNEYKEILLPKLKEVLDGMPADRKARLYEKKHISNLGIPLTRFEIISAALNLGSESNRDKLMRGGIKLGEYFSEISHESLDEMLSHLDDQDADMIQGLWDTVNTLWPDIAALEKKWTGLEPEKVEAVPVMIGGKELKGGYWMIVYDTRSSSFGEKQAQSAKVDQAFGPDFTRAKTRTGHTKKRTEAAAPLKLDFRSIMTKHMDQVITDLSHREFVDQFNRLIRSPDVKDALIQSIGEQEYHNLRGWGKATVNADNYADPSVTGMEKMLRAAKSNLTVAALGLNVAAAMADVGIVPVITMARGISPVEFAKGAAQFIAHPKETMEFMHEKSPAMRHHGMEIDQSITQTMDYLSGQNTHRAQVMRFALGMRAWVYHIGTATGWMSAYKKEMEAGTSEKEAIRISDKAVRMTQHAGDPGSLSALERHPFFKHFMMFSGPVVIAYNNMLYGAKEIHQRGATPELLGKIFATWFGQGILWSLLRGKGPDDQENWSTWLASHAIMGPLEAFPIIRDVLPSIEGMISGHFKQPRNLPLYSAVENVAKAGVATKKWLEGEGEAGKAVRADLSAAGSLAGIPSNQLDITGTYLYDVLTGQYRPAHPWSPLTDILYRRKQEK